MQHAQRQARYSSRNDLISLLIAASQVTGPPAACCASNSSGSIAVMNRIQPMGSSSTTFTRPHKLRSSSKHDETTLAATRMEVLPPSLRGPLTEASRYSMQSEDNNDYSHCARTSSIPISKRTNKQGFDSIDWEQQVAENTRLYDSSTWRMYHRIMEGRSRRPRTSVAPAPFRSKKLIARQTKHEWDATPKEPNSNDIFLSPEDDSYEDVFTLEME